MLLLVKIAGMFRKIKFTLRRLMTMANLFESLAEVYGDREAFILPRPLDYGRFPGDMLTLEDCRLFTSQAAEALINQLDMKKGDRVLLYTSQRSEYLLLAAAVIKAGGIILPMDPGLSPEEILRFAQGCWTELAIFDSTTVEEGLDMAKSLPGLKGWTVAGPRDEVPEGCPSLDAAMDSSSEFFLPYTLKPSNVVGVFRTREWQEEQMAVMVTNQALLAAPRLAALILPMCPSDRSVYALPLTSLCGFSAAVMGLCAGMTILLPGTDPDDILRTLQDSRAAVCMGVPSTFAMMLRSGAVGYDLSSVRLWFSASRGMEPGDVDTLRGLGCLRLGTLRLPAVFVEAYSAIESTTMLTLKPSFPGLNLGEGCLGFPLPPNRIKTVGEDRARVSVGEVGELAVKGPGATPGFWNNLDRTFRIYHKDWMHTGVAVRKGWFLHCLADEG
jgi:acyl-CoA synthetase (AMP-forming)/AMP-acid ligase II